MSDPTLTADVNDPFGRTSPDGPRSAAADTGGPDTAGPDTAGPDTAALASLARAATEAVEAVSPLMATHRLGRFVILEQIGEGAMGRVYSAYDPNLDRKIAIKLMQARYLGTRHAARMQREALAMARLSHPNVAQVYEVGEHAGNLFIAMEFVAGGTLSDWQADASRDWRATLQTYSQIGEGLAAAHRAGLIHRDFKPANVLVGYDERPRIIDFGLARGSTQADDTLDDARTPSSVEAAQPAGIPSLSGRLDDALTRVGAVLGTPAYMAPEQIRGEGVIPASDQFASCVALYEALYGEPPFTRGSLVARHDEIMAGKVRASPRADVAPPAVLEVPVGVLLATAVWRLWNTTFATPYARQLALVLIALFCGSLATQVVGIVHGLPPEVARAMDLTTTAMVAFTFGITVARWLLAVTAIMLISAIAIRYLPDASVQLYGVSYALTVLVGVVGTWGDARYGRIGGPPGQPWMSGSEQVTEVER